jgi:hypothetical protein
MWHISKDGVPLAAVSVRSDAGEVVVSTEVEGKGAGQSTTPRFATREAANAFLDDLIASFSYLGCDVSAA